MIIMFHLGLETSWGNITQPLLGSETLKVQTSSKSHFIKEDLASSQISFTDPPSLKFINNNPAIYTCPPPFPISEVGEKFEQKKVRIAEKVELFFARTFFL